MVPFCPFLELNRPWSLSTLIVRKKQKALFLFNLGELYLRDDASNLVSTVYAVRRSEHWQVSKLTGAH